MKMYTDRNRITTVHSSNQQRNKKQENSTSFKSGSAKSSGSPSSAIQTKLDKEGTGDQYEKDIMTTQQPAVQMKRNEALPENVQLKMESAFGESFSNVNIHTNSSQAKSLNALAFTQGNDVHFAPGQFSPNSRKGQELIGHEFAHVQQQRAGRVQPTIQTKGVAVNNDKHLESEADKMGAIAANYDMASQAGYAMTSTPSKTVIGSSGLVQKKNEVTQFSSSESDPLWPNHYVNYVSYDKELEKLTNDPNFDTVLQEAARFNTRGKIEKKNKAEDPMNHFRLDWVRNLELSLLGKRTKTDPSFDAVKDRELLIAIMLFQMKYRQKEKPDGKIEKTTRAMLEKAFPILYTKPLGDHLDGGRVLVRASASTKERYDYYRAIIENSGAYYNDAPHQTNILAIRGVSMNNDEVKQTSEAKEAAEALARGEETDYFNSVKVLWNNANKRAPNDLIISMWKDQAGDIHVEERMGTTEFGTTKNEDGGASLRDGQYSYMLRKHITSSENHIKNVKNVTGADKDPAKRTPQEQKAYDILKPDTKPDGRLTYNALVPKDKFELWRADPKEGTEEGKKKTNKFDNEDFETSTQKIYEGENNYVGRQGINFHTGTAAGVSTTGCQNLPADDFIKFMRELQENKELAGVGNKKDYTILYTLIDASKIGDVLN